MKKTVIYQAIFNDIMCNLNIFCKVSDGSCKCRMPECSGIVKPIPIPMVNSSDGVIILSLFKIVSQQNEMIKQILEDSKNTTERLNFISQTLKGKPSKCLETSSDEVTNSDTLMKILCGGSTLHEYSLQLISDLPKPAYKERAFSMLIQIVNKNGEKATLSNSAVFSIMLFTTESPPKYMKINTSGDKIMRGTVDSEGTSSVFFRKIVIKEVTSHFRNGCFFLVVTCKTANNIKPLIVPNFVIKARKLKCEDSPKKKIKVDEVESI